MSNKKEAAESSAENTTLEQALERKLKKKKSKTNKIILITVSVILTLVILFLGTCLIWIKVDMQGFGKFALWLLPDKFVYEMAIRFKGGDYIGLVSVDDGTSEWSDMDDESDFVPEDAPPVQAPMPDETPEYEIIDGWFDGDNISDKYEDRVLNILLIGADTLDGNSARSDTMILMSINYEKKRIVFTSFMRDSYVELPGRGYNRLNAAHSRGGPKYLIETLESNFGIDVDNYVKVDFTSFQGAIDSMGGIDITVNETNYYYFRFHGFSEVNGLSEAEACDGTHTIHMDGATALRYARARHTSDGVKDGDFGRTQHQRDLLVQFVNNLLGSGFGEVDSILKTLLPFVLTDMPHNEIESQLINFVKNDGLAGIYGISDTRVPCAGSWEYWRTEKGAEVLNINIPANAAYIKAKIYG